MIVFQKGDLVQNTVYKTLYEVIEVTPNNKYVFVKPLDGSVSRWILSEYLMKIQSETMCR